MKYKSLFLLLFVFVSSTLFPLSVNVRVFDHADFTRVVFEGSKGFEYSYHPSHAKLEVQLKQKSDVSTQVEVFRKSRLVERVVHHVDRDAKSNKLESKFTVYLKDGVSVQRNFTLEQPFRVVFDVTKDSPKNETASSNHTPVNTSSSPNSNGSKVNPANSPLKETKAAPQDTKEKATETPVKPQVVVDKDKKRSSITTICLDAGHGGLDYGAVGRTKTLEKELTLKIVNKLKKLIESKLGLYVVTTRDKDEDVSLNSRVAKANNQKAQMFISIHINSSFKKSANGPETYYASLNATDQESFQLSQKENASSGEKGESNEKEPVQNVKMNDELKMILWNMAQTEYIKESSALADCIQSELNILLDTANRGVKQAPFRVLMRAAMPAVLVEVAFLSNPNEEKKLQNEEFLNSVANSLFSGISRFISSYSINK